MTRQAPRGPEDMMCPKWLSPMSEVCHKCPLWTKLKMDHPQNKNDTIDEWGCSLAWTPVLLTAINNNLQIQLGAVQVELNELRNETKKAHDEHVAMSAIAVQRARDAVREAVPWGRIANQELTQMLEGPVQALLDSPEEKA